MFDYVWSPDIFRLDWALNLEWWDLSVSYFGLYLTDWLLIFLLVLRKLSMYSSTIISFYKVHLITALYNYDRAYAYDVTTAMLVTLNNEKSVMLVSQISIQY